MASSPSFEGSNPATPQGEPQVFVDSRSYRKASSDSLQDEAKISLPSSPEIPTEQPGHQSDQPRKEVQGHARAHLDARAEGFPDSQLDKQPELEVASNPEDRRESQAGGESRKHSENRKENRLRDLTGTQTMESPNPMSSEQTDNTQQVALHSGADHLPKWLGEPTTRYTGSEPYPDGLGLDVGYARHSDNPGRLPTSEEVWDSMSPRLLDDPRHDRKYDIIDWSAKPKQPVDPKQLRDLERALLDREVSKWPRTAKDMVEAAKSRGSPRRLEQVQSLEYERSPVYKTPHFRDIAPQDFVHTVRLKYQESRKIDRERILSLEKELEASKAENAGLSDGQRHQQKNTSSKTKQTAGRSKAYSDRLEDLEAELAAEKAKNAIDYDVIADKEEQIDKAKQTNSILLAHIQAFEDRGVVPGKRPSRSPDLGQEMEDLVQELALKDEWIEDLRRKLEEERGVNQEWNEANKVLEQQLEDVRNDLLRIRHKPHEQSLRSLRYRNAVDTISALPEWSREMEDGVAQVRAQMEAAGAKTPTSKLPQATGQGDSNPAKIAELRAKIRSNSEMHGAKEKEILKTQEKLRAEINRLKGRPGVSVTGNGESGDRYRWLSFPSTAGLLSVNHLKWFSRNTDGTERAGTADDYTKPGTATSLQAAAIKATGSGMGGDKAPQNEPVPSSTVKEDGKADAGDPMRDTSGSTPLKIDEEGVLIMPEPPQNPGKKGGSEEALQQIEERWKSNPDMTFQDLFGKAPPYSTSGPIGSGYGRIPEYLRANRSRVLSSPTTGFFRPFKFGRLGYLVFDWLHIVLIIYSTLATGTTFGAVQERAVWMAANGVTPHLYWNLLRHEIPSQGLSSFWAHNESDDGLFEGVGNFG